MAMALDNRQRVRFAGQTSGPRLGSIRQAAGAVRAGLLLKPEHSIGSCLTIGQYDTGSHPIAGKPAVGTSKVLQIKLTPGHDIGAIVVPGCPTIHPLNGLDIANTRIIGH